MGFITFSSLHNAIRSNFKWSAKNFIVSKFKKLSLFGQSDDILDNICKFFEENRSFNSTNEKSSSWHDNDGNVDETLDESVNLDEESDSWSVNLDFFDVGEEKKMKSF